MRSAPTCPSCGSDMVLRTARRGKNAGSSFYGCSRYPKCRDTLPANDSNSEPDKQTITPKYKDPYAIEFPRFFQSRSRFSDYQVRFHECVAVSSKNMELISELDTSLDELRQFSQWRLDFPITNHLIQFDDTQRYVLSVLEKILTRGRITTLSDDLEKKIIKIVGTTYDVPVGIGIFDELRCAKPESECTYECFDSKEESDFFYSVLPQLSKYDISQFVIPQVELSSLVSSNFDFSAARAQRVDFAILLPGKKNIVVEIDGSQHQQHLEVDGARDEMLERDGFNVIRIPVDEIRQGTGQNLEFLRELIESAEIGLGENDLTSPAFFNSFRIAHQIQLSILQALMAGFLDLDDISSWMIVSDLDEYSFWAKEEDSKNLLEATVEDFSELLDRIKALYGYESKKGNPKVFLKNELIPSENQKAVAVLFNNSILPKIKSFLIKNIFVPFHIASSSFPVASSSITQINATEEDLTYFLNYLFRKSSFREGQYEAIIRTLSGQDSLILLPTGAGKSIIYQMASMLIPGRTIVIDPIISLVEDQIDNLRIYGIDRCIGITSNIIEAEDRSKAMQLLGQGEYLFAFVAPERFQTKEFRESLRALTVHTPIAAIVADEAHCVSEWGHDFRTSYLNIGRISRKYCESNNLVPPLLALTGTASRAVLKDVQRELKIEDFDAIITPESFNRPELHFSVIDASSEEKIDRLIGYLGQALPGIFNLTNSTFYQARGMDTCSGIVFCPWVNGDFGVVQIKGEIAHELRIRTAHYSGGAPRGWDSRGHRQYKRTTEKQFKRNEISLLVSTKAFGMGIDKPNIRYTIHIGLPFSIESFYQEAGRAGRDRNHAHCCIIVSVDDVKQAEFLLNPSTSVEKVSERITSLGRDPAKNDDITRALFFHSNAFKGIEHEKNTVGKVIAHLGDITTRRTVNIVINSLERGAVEKALHRLLLIGVVEDYTIDYSSEEFSVSIAGADKDLILRSYGNYVAGYLESRRQTEIKKAHESVDLPFTQFVSATIELLLRFIYDVIERGRRRALHEMLLVCTTSPKDVDIRKRILAYLEATEYSERIENLLQSESVDFTKCKDIFSAIRSPNEAAELRGQVSRYLESYPDQPELLLLRFLSELYAKDTNLDICFQNFNSAINSAVTNYDIDLSTISEIGAWSISMVPKKYGPITLALVNELVGVASTRESSRALLHNLPGNLSFIPAWDLLARLNNKCKILLP